MSNKFTAMAKNVDASMKLLAKFPGAKDALANQIVFNEDETDPDWLEEQGIDDLDDFLGLYPVTKTDSVPDDEDEYLCDTVRMKSIRVDVYNQWFGWDHKKQKWTKGDL